MNNKTDIFLRKLWFYIVIMGIFGAFLYRLYVLQNVEHAQWRERAEKTHSVVKKQFYKRGTIYDRNHERYAASIDVKSLYCDPYNIDDPKDTATKIAMVIPLDRDTILKKILKSKKSRFMWLWRDIPVEYIEKIRGLKLKGVSFLTEYKRVYPEGKSCGNVLGFVGIDNENHLDNRGLEGIEYKFDSMLKGYVSYDRVIVDGKGKIVLGENTVPDEEKHARDIVLTIDKIIQHNVEEEIDRMMEQYTPKSAMVIVYDASNGEVLAMANRPDFDPADYRNYDRTTYKNRCITDIYEPGSVIKIVTVSAGIDAGVIDENFHVRCEGEINVDKGEPIKCEVAHGEVNLDKILVHSCNVGAVSVAQKLPRETYEEYLKNFGFSAPTNILLPGEVSGKLAPSSKWARRDQASISFGYAIAVTALQIISGCSAVINDGFVMRPIIIKEIYSREGKKLFSAVPEPVSRAINSETARRVNEILKRVVSEGTGKKAFIEGYEIAGKTGTAQKIDKGKYSEEKYRVSFMGFLKSPKKRLAVYAVIDEPKADRIFGGVIAAPLVNNIFQHLIRYYEIPPQIVTEEKETGKKITVPEFIGLSKKEVMERKKMFKLRIDVEGTGQKATFQFPEAGKSITENSRVYVYCGVDEKPDVGDGCMPYLIGKTLKESVTLLKKLGVKYSVQGNGIVESQEPPPGTRLDALTDAVIICNNR